MKTFNHTKYLTRLIKDKRKRSQINKIRHEKGEGTTDNAKIQRIMRLLQATVCQWKGQPGRNGQILRYSLPRLNQEETEYMNRPIQVKKLNL